ncbi:Ig-like domain (group 3), partial [Reichenbachiella faecimaris]
DNDITANVSDVAGNPAAEATKTVVYDITAPTIPTVNSQITSDDTPILNGTADAGSVVSVTVGGATFITVADAAGEWTIDTSLTPDSGVFAPNVTGSNEVVVSSSDAAGNTTVDSTNLELVILSQDSDGDNIPDIDEDLDGDGDPSNDDTDGDGTPDYQDEDDDGDGVNTEDEDIDSNGNPIDDDSDGDGTPDYLDEDDDGDGINTEDEDTNGNGDPTDDDHDGDGTPDYLDTTDDRALTVTMEEQCINDVPYVDYEVNTVGFDASGMTALVEWLNADGQVVQSLADQPLSGTLLWPGAEVDADGNGIAWPGWDLVDGIWIQIEDGLRNEMTVRISVNPESSLSVSYPPATPACAAQPFNPFDDEDTDGDGISDNDEDVDGDGNPSNDDTDGDGTPDYLDEDDDNDGILTGDEDVDQDGDPTNDDTDRDGTPDYLDTDDDGDGIASSDESGDCDRDGIPAYLDADPCEAPATVLNNVVSTSSPAPYNSLQIENIEDFPNNTVQIFNRWGNKVWETRGYDNSSNAFFGNGSGTGILGSNGNLPVGTYFYIVDLGGGEDLIKGFVRVE